MHTHTPSPAINDTLLRYGIFCCLAAALAMLGVTRQGTAQPLDRPAPPSYYEQGLAEKKKGNYEKVLALWERAHRELDEPDFRIAQGYIELVTEQELKTNYRQASEIYKWGLTGQLEAREIDFLLRELLYLRGLLGNGDYQDYKNAAEEGEASVLADIRQFWANMDPTPLTPYNERLMEHWERVRYARQHFTAGGELDDRAHTFLKYGEPYYKKEGQLNYVPALVTRLLSEGIRTPSFASADRMAISMTQRMNMENRVKRYHTYPRYEVWLYRGLASESENTVFLFGTTNGGNIFEKVKSVDEFIPNPAYRTSGQHNYSSINSGVSGGSQGQQQRDRESIRLNTINSQSQVVPQVDFSAALILQLMYYNQFAALDEYFGKAYNEMMDRFTNSLNSSRKGLARQFGSIYGTKLLQMQLKAPDEKSGYEEEIMHLPTENYVYRFIDEDNNPYVRLFSVTSLEEATYYDLLKETNSLQTEVAGRYVLVSGYKLDGTGQGEEVLQRQTERVHSAGQITSLLRVPYSGNRESVTISHELHTAGERSDSTVAADSPYPKSLKGLNAQEVELPEPLSTDKLTMSDLIIGYSSPGDEASDASGPDERSWNFTIAHDKYIPQGSELNMYYEVYNMEMGGEKGIAEYTFEYSIRGEKKGFLGLGNRLDDEQLSITINSTSASRRDRNTVVINTAAYETGSYQLKIEITDLHSGETFTKTVDFTIR